MYEEICYQKNNLKEVICRLDFANTVNILNTQIPKSVYQEIKKYYPISEPQDIIGNELQINPTLGSMMNNRILKKQWTFWSRDKKNSCIIRSECVIFSVHNYDIFDSFRSSILSILNAVMSIDSSIQGKRLGLRYINSIDLNNHNDWITGLFFDSLLANKSNNTMKLLSTLEYSIEDKDLFVRLNYGYENPDYPATLKKDIFTIDIDAYTKSLVFLDDLSKFIDDMHFEVQDRFEKMITQEYRNELNRL